MAVKVIGLDTAKNVFQCMEQMEAGERCCEKDSDEARDTGFLREPTEVRSGDRGHPRRALLVA